MIKALIMVLMLINWGLSILADLTDPTYSLLRFLHHVVYALIMFKVALILDDAEWFYKFTKSSVIRQLRRGNFK